MGWWNGLGHVDKLDWIVKDTLSFGSNFVMKVQTFGRQWLHIHGRIKCKKRKSSDSCKLSLTATLIKRKHWLEPWSVSQPSFSVLPFCYLLHRMGNKNEVSKPSPCKQLLALELRLARQKWISYEVFYAPLGLGVVTCLVGKRQYCPEQI